MGVRAESGVVVLSVVFAAGLCLAAAETTTKPGIESHLQREGFVELLVETQVRNMRQRYRLSPEQTEQVREALDHQDITLQFKAAGKMEAFERKVRKALKAKQEVPVEDVQEFVREVQPLCRRFADRQIETMNAIQSVMNDAQKKRYQEEIEERRGSFEELLGRLERWEKGDIRPGELKEQFGREEPTVSPEEIEQKIVAEINRYKPTSFDFWDLYVRTFIEAFGLEKGQQTLAWSVLGEIKSRAESYKRDHVRQYAEARTYMGSLRDPAVAGKTGEERREALEKGRRKLEELDEPLIRMFDELKTRLMRIPTTAQTRRANQVLSQEDEPATPADDERVAPQTMPAQTENQDR
ncbi:MAG: hypothetical protein GXY33_08275 [Phycisphaerae bacterium]|mgnify:FL=1|nr:hypothetical protein [Phycisphaerae bacterium]